MDIWQIIVWIGALRAAFLFAQWLYFNFWCRLNIDAYKYGWIVITGASDGIGKSISQVLAKRGFKLVLIARNKAKLEALVSELSSSSSNQNIKYVVADFQYSHRNPEEFYKHLTAQLSEYEISGLINNVGVLDFTPLSEQKLDKIEDMLGINIYPQTLLSYFIIPQFLQRFKESKKRSLLINFSSTADIVVLPTSAVYSATKRYAEYLSEGIRYEYSYAVDVATVKPGIVETNMTKSGHGNGWSSMPFTAEVNSYANYLIGHLHKGINYGHWKHSLVAFSMTMLPHQITNVVFQKVIPIAAKFGFIQP